MNARHTNRHAFTDWRRGFWPRRLVAAIVVAFQLALLLGAVHVPDSLSWLTALALIGVGVPGTYVVGLVLLTFGTAAVTPYADLSFGSSLHAVVSFAVVGIGAGALWWDWRSARTPQPEPPPPPPPPPPPAPEPPWVRELYGVFLVWWPVFFAAILIALNFLIGPFNAR